jgi:hypothetical protein
MNPTRAIAASMAVALLLSALPASAEYPDWDSVANVSVIEVITRDADGDLRESKVWFVLLEGVPYLRTNRSRWLDNLRRGIGVQAGNQRHVRVRVLCQIPSGIRAAG